MASNVFFFRKWAIKANFKKSLFSKEKFEIGFLDLCT